MKDAVAIVHASPQIGAAFTQYTVEFEPGGSLGPTPGQRFVFMLEGEIAASTPNNTQWLTGDEYVYLPQGSPYSISATKKSRAIVIEKKYVPNSGNPAGEVIFGDAKKIASTALMGDDALQLQVMIPDKPEHDFAVNLMTYQPGASLSMVEIHIMEHGLMMLEGGGIYRLGESWYPVKAGDFIWMAPFCPQWFGALGKTPAKYIIYKDSNRHPLGEI
jgi:(S)-ureidoglycine aminohydrolase